ACVTRPVELVGLAAVEEVELFRPCLEGALYGQPQGHEADAARRMAGVPARLIEVERPATAEAVQGRGRLPVDAENEEAEPSEREGQPAELVVKGDDARGVESIGPAPGPPPLIVEGEQRGQDLSAALLALHLLEADRRVPLKVPEPP